VTRWRTFRWRAALAWWRLVANILNARRGWLERRAVAWERLEDRVDMRRNIAHEVLNPPSEEVLKRRAVFRHLLKRLYPADRRVRN
jgi:hypothetical protein